MKQDISIIIPILNEAKVIGNLLEYLIENSSKKNIAEIIVVDGGSTDGTQELFQDFVTSSADEKSQKKDSETSSGLVNKSKIVLINSPKGRAKQMNLGAKHAKGNILYFLHADSLPPHNFDQHIIDKIEEGNKAGCFIMKFNSKHWWLKLAGILTRLPWKVARGGDQSLFITRNLFNTIGGYDERFTIYEDNNLIGRLYAKNQFIVIQKWLITSARRYEEKGLWRLQYHFWTIHLKNWLGADAETLHQYYLKHVSVKK